MTTLNCQFDSLTTVNDLLVVACMGNNANACLQVTDDANDTFKLIGGTTTRVDPTGATLVWGVWYSTVILSALSNVTCADPCANTTWVEESIHEYSGNMNLTDPLDVYSSDASNVFTTTTTTIAPAITPSINGELIFSVAPQMPGPATAGNGTLRTNSVWSTYWATEDYIQDPATVYQSSFTFASGGYANRISQASFKPPTPAPRGVETWQ